MRQRRSGASRVMSAPSNSTRPESGATVPVAMPNSVVLPAPFGPMMPSASPWSNARSRRSATTTAPNRLEMLSRLRIGIETATWPGRARPWRGASLAQRLQLAADRNFRRRTVGGDHQFGLVARALPLAGNQWRLGDVLDRLAGPLHRP